MESLEMRFYSNTELAEIAGLDAHSRNFAEMVRRRLTNWGYEYVHQPRRGYIITKVPTTPEERLIEILRRFVGIDSQVVPLQFACFLSAFALIPGFEGMPWEARKAMIDGYFAMNSEVRVMQNWVRKLIECDMMFATKDNCYLWHTYEENGYKIREKADPESEEYKEYCEERTRYLNDLSRSGCSSSKVWGRMVKTLYNQYGVYYYCKALNFNGFLNDKLHVIVELAQEIILGQAE